jgi:uncharacterized membrane protein YjgN (DUF898 family)
VSNGYPENRRRSEEGISGSSDRNQFQRDEVQAETSAVLDSWQSAVALSRVRRRLWSVLGTGLVMTAIYFFLDPGGLAGLLLTLWFLLSVPVVALAACILVLLRDPANATDVWWDSGAVATIGLISLAGFTRIGRATPFGRTVWQLFFGSEHPADENYKFGTQNSNIDLSAVARIRRYLWFAVVGSVGIVLAEQLIRQDALGAGVFEDLFGTDPGPAALVGVFIAVIILGLFLGALAAAWDS